MPEYRRLEVPAHHAEGLSKLSGVKLTTSRKGFVITSLKHGHWSLDDSDGSIKKFIHPEAILRFSHDGRFLAAKFANAR